MPNILRRLEDLEEISMPPDDDAPFELTDAERLARIYSLMDRAEHGDHDAIAACAVIAKLFADVEERIKSECKVNP